MRRRGYTRRRWTCTSSGRSRRPPNVPPWTPSSDPPTSRWVGGARDVALDGHASQGGHAARARRDLLLPGLHAVQGPHRLDQPAGDQLRLQAARRAARRGIRRGDVLRPVRDQAPAAGRRPCLRRHRLPARRRRDDLRRPRAGRRPAGAPVDDGRSTWLRSPCLGLCDPRRPPSSPLPGNSRATSRPRPGRRGGDRCAPGCDHGARAAVARVARSHRRNASSASCGGSASSTPPRSTTTARTAATGAGPRAGDRPGRRHRRGHRRRSLVGRGGAAFPTGRKWAAVAAQPAQPHYVVCNADESEPGTFKDRVLLEGDPFAIVEAMTIAGFATGAEQGYLYLRGEYPEAEATRRPRDRGRARAPASSAGRPGLGLRLRHRAPARCRRLHLRRGDGALRVDRGQARRAAEQAAVPGRGRAVRQADRGEQRRDAGQRPAHPRDGRRGLRRDRHRGLRPGRSSSACPGHVARPGVYEVEFGATLRDLIDLAGGVPRRPRDPDDPAGRRGGRLRRAGRARHAADVRGDPRHRGDPRFGRRHGVRRDRRPRRHAPADRPVLPRRVVRPVRAVPGRQRSPGGAAGAARARARASGPRDEELALLREIGQAMRDASICGLGQTASSAIESALRQPGLVAL